MKPKPGYTPMPESAPETPAVERREEHPAFLAWRQLDLTGVDPTRIDVLKESKKTLACRLVACGPEGANVIAKRRVTEATIVEQAIYRQVLARFSGPSLRLLGSLDEPDEGTTWLFLDDGGEVMPDFQEPAHRKLAGSWLGRLHTELSGHPCRETLPERASGYALELLHASRDGLRAGTWNPRLDEAGWRVLRSLMSRLDAIEAAWPQIEAQVSGLPATIVHGDFVAKNLRLLSDEKGQFIVPFDWETAGWGAPLIDLEFVDLKAYWSETNRFWGGQAADLRRLVDFGLLFRWLAAASWDVPALPTPWISRPVYRLAFYDEQLAATLDRLGLATRTPRSNRAAPTVIAYPNSGVDPAMVAWLRLWPGRATVHAVEEIKGGTRHSRVVRLRGVGPGSSDVIAKRCAVATGETERTIHEDLLPSLGVPALRFYGSVEADDPDSLWLFLEDAGDLEYEPDEARHRRAAACWLAVAHTAATKLPTRPDLPERGTDYYLGVLRAAKHTILAHRANPAIAAAGGLDVLDDIVRRCDVIETRWGEIAAVGRTIPTTLVHGGFDRKNVRIVAAEKRAVEVRVFDWEYAGWGLPAADIATVDIDLYVNIIRDTWPQLDAGSMGTLVHVGTLLRAISAIPGESRSLASAWPQRVLAKMPAYRAMLEQAMLALAMEPGTR
jgi:Ser/Thr protein kinase RdoA (MazF antagonist)